MKTWIQTSALFGILALASGCGQGDAAPANANVRSQVGQKTQAPQNVQISPRTGGNAQAPVAKPKPPEEKKAADTVKPSADDKKVEITKKDDSAKKDDKSARKDEPRRDRGTFSFRGTGPQRGNGNGNGNNDRSPRGGDFKKENNKGGELILGEGGDDRPRGMAGPGSFGRGTDSRIPFKNPTLPSGLPAWFGESDTNHDGQVTMNEWPRNRLEDFNKVDFNGDGIITMEEALRTMPKVASNDKPATPPSDQVASNDKPATPAGPPVSNVIGGSGTMMFGTPGQPGQPMVFMNGGGGEDRNVRMAEGTIRRYDRNNDSMLDGQEIQETQMLRDNWQQHDTNKDGKLDKNEVAAAFKNMPSMGGGGRGFGGGGERGFGGGGDRGGNRGGNNVDMGERATRMLKQFDRNGDGKLSFEEYPTWSRKDRFNEFDKNKDGSIDSEELKSALESMTQGGGGGNRGGFGGGGGNRGGGGDRGGGGNRGGGIDMGGEFRRRDR
jgi:Ca2+-binding EF-hand superfamily protein